MLNILIEAIKNKSIITFNYKGHYRVAEPHAVGVSNCGNDVLRCYQIDGTHADYSHDWDLMYVSEIKNLNMSATCFSTARPGYRKGDRGMLKIYAEI